MRARAEGDSPCSTNSTARRRRRSSSAAVPRGLVIPYDTDVQHKRQALTTRSSVTDLHAMARPHMLTEILENYWDIGTCVYAVRHRCKRMCFPRYGVCQTGRPSSGM